MFSSSSPEEAAQESSSSDIGVMEKVMESERGGGEKQIELRRREGPADERRSTGGKNVWCWRRSGVEESK